MTIHTAKTMGDVMKLILAVSSRAEGRRFVMEYLEASPDLTEENIIANIKYGLSRHFDGGEENDRQYRLYVDYFISRER